MTQRKPKFRIGQVVSIRSFYGNFAAGETGLSFKGKRGWRHGWEFGKIVGFSMPTKAMKKTAPICYFLDGWMSAQAEDDLRALTSKESWIRSKVKE